MALGPLDMIQGATKRCRLTATNDDGTMADLTGCTAEMMVRKSYASSPLLTLTTENGGLAIDATAGTITFTISAAQSATLPVSYATTATANNSGISTDDPSVVLPFDVKVTYPSGDVVILDDPVDIPFALTVYGAVTR